jgi:cytoskeletal protein CcmA (bactofilin family)
MSNKGEEGRESVLGKETLLKGRLVFHRTLIIKGSFEGEIEADGDIVIEDGATVQAKLEAANAEIWGSLRGDVQVSGRLELGEQGSLVGDVKAQSLRIEQGAYFKGRIDMLKNPEQIDIFSASPEQLKNLVTEKTERNGTGFS